MKKIYLIAFLLLTFNKELLAQDQQLITYHGQLRTLLSDNRLNGNLLRGDTSSARRGALGTIFMDLGITVKPNEDFKLYAEFRMRNIIGQNTQQSGVTVLTGNPLIDTRMIFRQVRAEGNIRKVVQYQIGDIDLGLTKYTLYNNPEIFNMYEADIFKQRRAIPQYEKFQFDNLWRFQGANAKTQINFDGVIRRIDLNLFGVRTKINTSTGVPDRFVTGGKLDILQSKYFNIGGNWLNMFDVAGTALNDTLVNYNNNVLSTNYKITPYNKGKFEINILGENGTSRNKYFIKTLDTTSHKKDFFIDAGIKATYKPMRIALTASYVNVGHNFTSPGAQSLRLNPTGLPQFFPTVNNGATRRPLTIYDRFTDDNIYNQSIQPGLATFVPVYGNVLPYGAATPNRKGLIFNVGRTIDTSNVLSFNAGGALLSETVSEGDVEGKKLRNFLQLQGGTVVNFSKLMKIKRTILFTTGARYEHTTRDGAAFIDFKSVLVDAGITAEFARGIYLMAGSKYIKGNGTEVLTQRDPFGSITGYSLYLYNTNQFLLSGGLRLDLFKNSFASVEYNRLVLTNFANETQNYSWGNFFINFTLRF